MVFTSVRLASEVRAQAQGVDIVKTSRGSRLGRLAPSSPTIPSHPYPDPTYDTQSRLSSERVKPDRIPSLSSRLSSSQDSLSANLPTPRLPTSSDLSMRSTYIEVNALRYKSFVPVVSSLGDTTFSFKAAKGLKRPSCDLTECLDTTRVSKGARTARNRPEASTILPKNRSLVKIALHNRATIALEEARNNFVAVREEVNFSVAQPSQRTPGQSDPPFPQQLQRDELATIKKSTHGVSIEATDKSRLEDSTQQYDYTYHDDHFKIPSTIQKLYKFILKSLVVCDIEIKPLSDGYCLQLLISPAFICVQDLTAAETILNCRHQDLTNVQVTQPYAGVNPLLAFQVSPVTLTSTGTLHKFLRPETKNGDFSQVCITVDPKHPSFSHGQLRDLYRYFVHHSV